jgi:Tfp pilus assembly protein PilF
MADDAYSLFQKGQDLLARGHPYQAVIPLERARDLEPQKASIRETLARAYFRSGRTASAQEEFAAVLEIDPVNDYAHFGLALCLERLGEISLARRHAKLAVAMRPDQASYREALERIAPEPTA